MKKIVINLFFILSLNVDTFLLIQIMFIHTYIYIYFFMIAFTIFAPSVIKIVSILLRNAIYVVQSRTRTTGTAID